MELREIIDRIDELKLRSDAAGALSADAKRKLDYRFRLDWNYHSNVMEGSSLTQQETRSIMLGNVTISGKPIKDVLEMKGHDELVSKLLGMAKGELNLSESRIREMHRAIVHEDESERKEQIGQWKKEPNFLTNYRGERFDFLAPADVPEAMHKLLDRTKAEIERIERGTQGAQHPALLAFRFHLDYVTIHPFHDGNGRTARLLSNLLLMRFGYPPVVIRVDEKENYNRYLAEVQAYGAAPDLFFAFMAERLVRAQQLVVDVIEGKDISEPSDFEKRLALLDKQTREHDAPALKMSIDSVERVYNEALAPLFRSYADSMLKLAAFFQEFKIEASLNNGAETKRLDPAVLLKPWFEHIIRISRMPPDPEKNFRTNLNGFKLRFELKGFKRGKGIPFSIYSELSVYFQEWSYLTSSDQPRLNLQRPYRHILTAEERDGFVEQVRMHVLDEIVRHDNPPK